MRLDSVNRPTVDHQSPRISEKPIRLLASVSIGIPSAREAQAIAALRDERGGGDDPSTSGRQYQSSASCCSRDNAADTEPDVVL